MKKPARLRGPDLWLIVALVAIAVAAAAIMTRPDLPPRLVAALSVFGSVLVGGSVIYASLSGRDDER
jgi:hypothetical protein